MLKLSNFKNINFRHKTTMYYQQTKTIHQLVKCKLKPSEQPSYNNAITRPLNSNFSHTWTVI
jgi:hypothetical protein